MDAPTRKSTSTVHCGRQFVQITPHSCARVFLSIIFATTLAQCGLPPSDLTLKNEAKGSYDLYMKHIEDLDALDRPNLQEFRDFESSKLMEQLIQIAESKSTPPTLLHEELKEIIQYSSANLLDKYKISDNPKVMNRNTTTITRLILMFPHYYNRFYVKLPINGYVNEAYCPASFWPIRPNIMDHPEFGGLIPRPGSSIPDDVRSKIIKVHAYSLIFCKGAFVNTIDTVGPELKERINKSLLSDEHRVRLLKKVKILTQNELLSPAVIAVHNLIPEGIRQALDSIVFEVS